MIPTLYAQTIFKYEASDGLKIYVDVTAPVKIRKNGSDLYHYCDGLVEQVRKELTISDPEFESTKNKYRQEFENVFGEHTIYIEEIPNQYSSSYYYLSNPWFIVTTRKGRIKLGWRKRVISIQWDDSQIEQTAEQLFPNENTTKEGRLIHAWGYDKAKEYIDTLLK